MDMRGDLPIFIIMRATVDQVYQVVIHRLGHTGAGFGQILLWV
jgi:hypothetical protein